MNISVPKFTQFLSGTEISTWNPNLIPLGIGNLIQQNQQIDASYAFKYTSSVAAKKILSKFHAKVSGQFWHESLEHFDETFA